MSILGDDWFDSEITEEFLSELGFYKIRKDYYSNHYSSLYQTFYINYSKRSNSLYISDRLSIPRGTKYKVYSRLDFLGTLNAQLGKSGVEIIGNE